LPVTEIVSSPRTIRSSENVAASTGFMTWVVTPVVSSSPR
jgi:hypothetical protein